MTTATARQTAPARQTTLAEAVNHARQNFQGTVAYKRNQLTVKKSQFKDTVEGDTTSAILTCAGPLLKLEATVEVWNAFSAAFDAADETGEAWSKLSYLADLMLIPLSSYSTSAHDHIDQVRASLEVCRAYGRDAGLQDIRALINRALAAIAAATA